MKATSYFRIQLSALGVNADYVEFWFGHKNKVYIDVNSMGEEFHRNLYRKADFSITPKTQGSRLDLLKQLITSFGYNPDTVLARDLTNVHTTIAAPDGFEESAEAKLTRILKQAILQDIAASVNTFTRPRHFPSVSYGSRGEIQRQPRFRALDSTKCSALKN